MRKLGTWSLGLALIGGLCGSPAVAQDAWVGVPDGSAPSLAGPARQVGDAQVSEVLLGAGGRVVALEFVNCRDVVMVQEQGRVSRVSATGLRLEASAQLAGTARDLAVSARGVLVAHGTTTTSEVTLLDPSTLTTRASWSLPGYVHHVAAGPEGELALAFWTERATASRPDLVSVIDLQTNTNLGRVAARDLGQATRRHPSGLPLYDFQMAELTRDGQALIVMSGETLHRLALQQPGAGPASTAASSSSSYNANYGAANAVDGNTNTYWIGGAGAAPWTLDLDLGSVQSVSGLTISWYSSSYYQASDMDVLTSLDGATFTPARSQLSGQAAADLDLGGTNARFVRLAIRTLNGGSFPVIRELEVTATDLASAFDFQESGPRIGQNPQRLELSDDGGYVALPSGGGNYAVSGLPAPGPYGLYVFGTDDLLQPVLAFSNGAYPRALGFDAAAHRIYGSTFDDQLRVFDALGAQRASYQLTSRGDQVLRQLVAPQGGQVFTLSGNGQTLLRVTLP